VIGDQPGKPAAGGSSSGGGKMQLDDKHPAATRRHACRPRR
jgi:hypothetical protein